MTDPTLTFAAWTADLQRRGFLVLPASHAVPVEVWLREPSGHVLLLRARGTRVVLRRYAGTDLTGLILRSECDCEAHRLAGAARRTTLAPGARPIAEAVYDGAVEQGWIGVQAALVSVPAAAALLDSLLQRLPAQGTAADAAPAQPERSTAVA